ncbi:MAG: glutathione S-transferase [Halioglobus sp.]|jgi:glutathione S-transferase
MNYLSVEDAISASGLRLVLTADVPGPWGEAAKSMLVHKDITYTAVRQEGGQENSSLMEWTGQSSAPVAVLEGIPPVSHWLDLLMLTERLAPEAPLVPTDMAARTDVLGLSALIAGVDGFGWNRRLHMLAPMLMLPEPPEMAVRLGEKFGWSDQAFANAIPRLQAISGELDRRLEQQDGLGSVYLVGDSVSAVDFYWANFAGMVKPLGAQDNPMPDYMRATYQAKDELILSTVSPRLEAHRDMMYQRHIALPLDY